MRGFIPFPLPPVLARLHALLEGYTEEREQGFFLAEQDRSNQAQAQPVLIYVTESQLNAEVPATLEKKPPAWIGQVVTHDSSVERMRRYAAAGVQEYWRVAVDASSIEVHREPQPDGTYARREIFTGDDPVISPTFADLKLTPARLVSEARP